MSGIGWLDVMSCILVLLGAILSLSAGVGLLRFPDMIARLHAQAKPQAAGLLFILVGLALQQEGNWSVIFFLIPILIFQFVTTPAAGMVLARGGYRSKHYEHVHLYVDELKVQVDRAQRAEDAAAERERARSGAREPEEDRDRDLDPGAPGTISL